MKTITAGWLAVLASASVLLGHHSLANFDTTKAVRVKGTIVRFQEINPHSFIFLDEKGPDGQTRRWAIEGPAIRQLNRLGIGRETFKTGDVVEVCGYVPKETIVWQIASADPTATSLSGRLLNAETLLTSDGKQQSWGDYGAHKCFAPGYTDQHGSR